MKRLILPVAIAIFVGPFVTCVKHRRVVTTPAVTVTVVDAEGAPVAGAHVVVHHWSYPYGRLEQSYPFEADERGVVEVEGGEKGEKVMPFCMHGVPEHHYTVCAGAAGHGWRSVAIDDPRHAGAITIELEGSEYADECDDFDRSRFGASQ